jgi:hypothetical protein
MFRFPRLGRRAIQLTARILQVERIEQMSTFITLISTRIVVPTQGTFALYESIG